MMLNEGKNNINIIAEQQQEPTILYQNSETNELKTNINNEDQIIEDKLHEYRNLLEELMIDKEGKAPFNSTIYKYWNMTDALVKDSQRLLGNPAKLEHVYQKFKNKECLNILVLGGSITDKRWHNPT
eukprot:UN34469